MSEEKLWIRHPKYTFIEISEDGEIRMSGKIVKPYIYDGLPRVKFRYGKIRIQAALLVLQAWSPCPGDPKYYRIGYYDGNPLNISPFNLYWYSV